MATFTGCQLRLSTSVGRSSTLVMMSSTVECLLSNAECRKNDEARMSKIRRTARMGDQAAYASDIRHSSFPQGCPSGVEPPPSGSQPAVQKPLHHRHHIQVRTTKHEVRNRGGIVNASDSVLRTSHFVLAVAPTRTRTRNTPLEAGHDFHFTIGAHHPFAFKRKARDSNPHLDEREPP